MSPLVVSVSLAIAMALAAGGAFLYLRLTARRRVSGFEGVFPQAGGFDRSNALKLIETDCSATYVAVDGPDFTGSFPPPKTKNPEVTVDIRRKRSPSPESLAETIDEDETEITRELVDDSQTLFDRVIVQRDGLSRSDEDLDAPTHRYSKPVKHRIAYTIPRPLVD